MRGMIAVVAFTLLTAFCWGIYGPVLQNGYKELQGTTPFANSLLGFVCVGLAYFGIAVIAPVALLKARGEAGSWTTTGTVWSLIAGAAGALGALGILLAIGFRGSPVYVMPLVFGGAPVINTFVTMYMSKTTKQAGPVFFAGLILVVAGAVTVLLFRPAIHHAAGGAPAPLTAQQLSVIVGSIILAAVSWGVYGPVLHKGQVAMSGSRLRPLICVGMSYFLIAVLATGAVLLAMGQLGGLTTMGTTWSLAGGAAGAVGALGIIMAFTFGGKPIYVMPLVFGLAPVINTFVGLIATGAIKDVSTIFMAGLIMVVAGAVTVLLFAPKAKPHAAHK